MKNLAILIGVADYQHINKLSPCNRDIELISNILDISEKYQEVLLLNNSPFGSTAKDQIAEFIRLHQESDIDEIFIYTRGMEQELEMTSSIYLQTLKSRDWSKPH